MTLETADKYAEKIIDELAPFSDRIAVAGSIRRRRPEVGDIDIVCLPKPGKFREIRSRCLASGPQILADGTENLRIRLANDVQVEIYFATPPSRDLFRPVPGTWGTRLLCRTGSKQFNIWFAQKAKARGLHWNPYFGIYFSSQCVAAETEKEMFKALKLDFIKPENREK